MDWEILKYKTNSNKEFSIRFSFTEGTNILSIDFDGVNDNETLIKASRLSAKLNKEILLNNGDEYINLFKIDETHYPRFIKNIDSYQFRCNPNFINLLKNELQNKKEEFIDNRFEDTYANLSFYGLDSVFLAEALKELGWCDNIEYYNEISGDIYLKSDINWHFDKLSHFLEDLGFSISPMFDY